MTQETQATQSSQQSLPSQTPPTRVPSQQTQPQPALSSQPTQQASRPQIPQPQQQQQQKRKKATATPPKQPPPAPPIFATRASLSTQASGKEEKVESESKSQPPSLISSAEPTSLSQVMHVEDDDVSIESSSYMPRARDTVATQSRSGAKKKKSASSKSNTRGAEEEDEDEDEANEKKEKVSSKRKKKESATGNRSGGTNGRKLGSANWSLQELMLLCCMLENASNKLQTLPCRGDDWERFASQHFNIAAKKLATSAPVRDGVAIQEEVEVDVCMGA